MPYANTDAMSAHRAEIVRHVWPGAHAILVVPATITLLTLPPCGPELNPVETIWPFLRQNHRANRVFDSYDTTAGVCCNAWNTLLAIPDRVASITSGDWAEVNG